METAGWIKIHRKILEWEWYSDTNMFRVFMHLLLTANRKDRMWHGTLIKRGQCVISVRSLAKTLGLSVQHTRRTLANTQLTHETTQYSTHKYTVITVVNFEKYQQRKHSKKNETNTEPTQYPTTPKEERKEKGDIKKKITKKKTEQEKKQLLVEFEKNFDLNRKILYPEFPEEFHWLVDQKLRSIPLYCRDKEVYYTDYLGRCRVWIDTDIAKQKKAKPKLFEGKVL